MEIVWTRCPRRTTNPLRARLGLGLRNRVSQRPQKRCLLQSLTLPQCTSCLQANYSDWAMRRTPMKIRSVRGLRRRANGTRCSTVISTIWGPRCEILKVRIGCRMLEFTPVQVRSTRRRRRSWAFTKDADSLALRLLCAGSPGRLPRLRGEIRPCRNRRL